MGDLVSRILRGSDAEFVHLDPGLLFKYARGRVTTPQQTDALYTQLSTLDVGLVKQSGCISEWWFCSRWKTGQRLVNLMSAGVPTIVWGNAQGHLDIVEDRWPPDDLTGRRWSRRDDAYPSDLVVHNDEDVAVALHALLTNATFREEASGLDFDSLRALASRTLRNVWLPS